MGAYDASSTMAQEPCAVPMANDRPTIATSALPLFASGFAVRCVLGIGDRDVLEARVGKRCRSELGAARALDPNHQATARILRDAFAIARAGLHHLLDVADVCGQKQVERRALRDLAREQASRAQAELQIHRRGRLSVEGGSKLSEGVSEIR